MCDATSPCGQHCERTGQHSLHTIGLESQSSEVEVWL